MSHRHRIACHVRTSSIQHFASIVTPNRAYVEGKSYCFPGLRFFAVGLASYWLGSIFTGSHPGCRFLTSSYTSSSSRLTGSTCEFPCFAILNHPVPHGLRERVVFHGRVMRLKPFASVTFDTGVAELHARITLQAEAIKRCMDCAIKGECGLTLWQPRGVLLGGNRMPA